MISKKIDIYINTIIVSGGNILELYNFILFPALAIYMSKAFFTTNDPKYSLILALGVASISHISRPIGSLFLGHLGDKWGRKNVLTSSILITSTCSLLIALIPSVSKIGILAPIILIIVRFIQGFCISGEEGNAIVYLAEKFGSKSKGFSSGIILSGIYIGMLLGLFACTLIEYLLTTEQMMAWGWRIPFLSAFLMGLVFAFFRKRLKENTEFLQYKEKADKHYSPIKDLFSNYKMKMLQLILFNSTYSVASGMLLIFLPLELSKDVPRIFFVMFLLVVSLLLPLAGNISDIHKRKNFMMISLFSVFPIVYLMVFFIYFKHQYLIGISLLSLLVLMVSPILPFFINSFPLKIRCTGVSFSFTVSLCIFHGLYPFVTSLVNKKMNIEYGWIYFLYTLTVVSICSLFFLSVRKTDTNSLKRLLELDYV